MEILGGLRGVAHAWSLGDIHVGVALYMVGLIAIMGGILALGRRAWGLVLTGAICALLGSMAAPMLLVQAHGSLVCTIRPRGCGR